MSRLNRFRAIAMLGYVLVIALLGGGLMLGVGQLDRLATSELSQVREQEAAATMAEQVRWSAAVASSVGRGYLIAGSPTFLVELARAEASFEERVRFLRERPTAMPPSPAHEAELTRVEDAAAEYHGLLKQAIAEKDAGAGAEQLTLLFESKVQPSRRALEVALDDLVQLRSARASAAYTAAEQARARWMLGARGVAGVLTLLAIGVAWYFASWLARSHRAEQRAHAAAKRAVRARDELLGIIAHDLRNPLGAIAMKAAALRRAGTSEDTRECARSIESTVMRTDLIIKGMLDATALDEGRLSVSMVRCDTESMLRETFELFGRLAESKQIALTRAETAQRIAVRGDRDRIVQVLSILIGNALKFTPRGGRVAVAVERTGGTVRFAVSDNGPGVPTEIQPRLFDRFLRVERAGTKGTGLGLYVAKGIVGAHGGRIWAESAPGDGATFYFTLEAAEPVPVVSSRMDDADAMPAVH